MKFQVLLSFTCKGAECQLFLMVCGQKLSLCLDAPEPPQQQCEEAVAGIKQPRAALSAENSPGDALC